jgi:hypothetical protein
MTMSKNSEFLNQWRAAEERIVCNWAFNLILSRFPARINLRARRLLALLFLFIIFSLLELGLLAGFGRLTTSFVLPALIVAVIASLSIYVINWAYQYIDEQTHGAVNSSPIGEKLDASLGLWARRVTKVWAQLAFSFAFMALVIGFLTLVERRVGLPFDYDATILPIILLTFWGGQGIYWALVLPTVTEILRGSDSSDIDLYYPSPGRTPLLSAQSRIFAKLAMLVGLQSTITLVGLFALRPDVSTFRILYPIVLLLGVYAIAGWTFLYPQANLSEIVTRAKRAKLAEIDGEIHKSIPKLEEIDAVHFDHLKGLVELHDLVDASPRTAEFYRFRVFVGSIITPTLAVVAGLVDWQGIFQQVLLGVD